MTVGTGTSTENFPEAHNLMCSEYYAIYISFGFTLYIMK